MSNSEADFLVLLIIGIPLLIYGLLSFLIKTICKYIDDRQRVKEKEIILNKEKNEMKFREREEIELFKSKLKSITEDKADAKLLSKKAKTDIELTNEGKNIMYSDVSLSGKKEERQSVPSRSVEDFTGSMGNINQKNSDNTSITYQAESSSSKPYYENYLLEYQRKQKRFFEDIKKYNDRIEPKAGFIRCKRYSPTYETITERQLKWYFYWRGEVRKENYIRTDLSYIFLYIYEIINGGGWKNPTDGYFLLMKVWDAYRESFPILDRYLNEWSFDFVQVNNLDSIDYEGEGIKISGHPIVQNLLIDKHQGDKPLKMSFALIETICLYTPSNLKFYNDGHQELMEEAIPRALALVDAALLSKKGKGILSIYGPSEEIEQYYYPYYEAVYNRPEERTKISVRSYMSCEGLRDYVNAVVRFTENTLRELYDCSTILPIKYTLDIECKELIRNFILKEYSLSTWQKEDPMLIQDEMSGKREAIFDFSAISELRAQSDAVRDALEVLSDDSLTEDSQIECIKENENEYIKREDASINGKKYIPFIFFDLALLPENLATIISEMNEYQQEGLWTILTSKNIQCDLNKIAEKQMTMPENIIDEINEISMSQINDIIIDTIEDIPSIFEEYREKFLKAIIEENR